MKKLRFLLPLLVFLAIAAFLAVGLKLNPRELPSPLVDKPAPAFEARRLGTSSDTFSPSSMAGKVWLLNVWASWCVSCRQEHPVLTRFAQQGLAPVVGLNHKDQDDAALRWLQLHGNPYLLSIVDQEGRIGIDYGVYGVPETFVIDARGIVRYRHTGPITQELLESRIIPLIRRLNAT